VGLDAKRPPLDAIVHREEFIPTLERVWRTPEAEPDLRAGRQMDAIIMLKTLVLGTR
jgi:hypothetical protein